MHTALHHVLTSDVAALAPDNLRYWTRSLERRFVNALGIQCHWERCWRWWWRFCAMDDSKARAKKGSPRSPMLMAATIPMHNLPSQPNTIPCNAMQCHAIHHHTSATSTGSHCCITTMVIANPPRSRPGKPSSSSRRGTPQ